MNSRMKIALGAALLLASLAPAQQLQKITINYPNRSGSNWPLFIAKDGGYFQKYGLDVNLLFGVHPAGVAMLTSNSGQGVNSSLEQMMEAASQDGSLVLVESTLNRGTFALMAAKNIQSIKDLKGKRIAVSQIGDAPYGYVLALLATAGLKPRDVQWISVGTDVNGRAAALTTGRADATLLTAPAYFKVEAAGFKTLANLAEHPDIFASTGFLMKKSTVQSDPALAEKIIEAQAEAVKRFYDDKPFAVKTFLAYDKGAIESEVERVYDLYAKPQAFERVPYILAGAVQAVRNQQPDPQLAAKMKAYDFRKIIDNSAIERLVKQGFFEKLYGPSIKAEEDKKAKLAFK